MGRASSSKKVARAAGIGGGRTSRKRTPWTYYSVILVIILLGTAAVWSSRSARLAKINAAGSSSPPTVGSTESAAFAVDICGHLQPNLKTNKNPHGITTHGDGIIHIHPTAASAAGKNATLGLFASSIGMQLNSSELQVPGGHLYVDGNKCGGSAGHVYVRHFAYPGDTVGTLETTDPQFIHLDDGSEYTIAFVPRSDRNKIPPPPASVVKTLTKLEAASASSSTTSPSATSPSTPSSPTPSSPSTTAPSKSSPSTTAPSHSSPSTTAKR